MSPSYDTASLHRLADEMESDLRAAGTGERARQEKRYLKSDLEHLGADAAALRRVTGALLRAHPDLPREAVVELAEILWAEPVHERRAVAMLLLDGCVARLGPEEMGLLERLIRESRTWALVDDLAIHVAGPLVERHPRLGAVLDRWAWDPDFWLRRAALLALLLPLRRGEGDFARFSRYADAMLAEKEFFLRKAIGWVLRETSKKQPHKVYDWLRPRVARASGFTVREASKRLPEVQREELLALHRQGRASSRSQRG